MISSSLFNSFESVTVTFSYRSRYWSSNINRAADHWPAFTNCCYTLFTRYTSSDFFCAVWFGYLVILTLYTFYTMSAKDNFLWGSFGVSVLCSWWGGAGAGEAGSSSTVAARSGCSPWQGLWKVRNQTLVMRWCILIFYFAHSCFRDSSIFSQQPSKTQCKGSTTPWCRNTLMDQSKMNKNEEIMNEKMSLPTVTCLCAS